MEDCEYGRSSLFSKERIRPAARCTREKWRKGKNIKNRIKSNLIKLDLLPAQMRTDEEYFGQNIEHLAGYLGTSPQCIGKTHKMKKRHIQFKLN